MQAQDTKLNFNDHKIYVGIDVHKKSWKVSIMVDDILHKRYSQNPDPDQLVHYLKRNFPGGHYYSAYEAGFCGFWIHKKLENLGINSIVVNPADVPTSDKERRQKEDKRDSLKIAKSLKNGEMNPIHIPSNKTIEDRLLVRTRTTLVKDLRRNKSRVKSFLNFYGINIPAELATKNGYWSNKFTKWLESIELKEESGTFALQSILVQAKNTRKQVFELTKRIRDLSNTEPYHERARLLKTVPGIGILTAMVLLTELEDINRFKNLNMLCSYIGLIPSTRSSGENDKVGKMTPRGHSFLRSALVESAWVAIRTDPALLLRFKELCLRMEPNKAIIRITKKLLNRIVHVLRKKEEYEKSVLK